MECNQLTLVLRTKVQFKRNKQNVSKCEHFLDFVFMSGLLQDVAYGVTKIKYDSVEEQKVAHAVLTTKVMQYLFTSKIAALMVYFLFILSSQSDFQYCNSNCKIKKKKYLFLIWCDLIYVSKHLMNLT